MKVEPKNIKRYYFLNGKEEVHEVSYVIVPLLPEEQRKPFKKWLINEGKTPPLITEETYYRFDCAFYHDYEEWYEWYNRDIISKYANTSFFPKMI